MSGVRQSLQNFKTAVSVNHSVSKSDTISAQVNKIPAKQEKQNQWKVNHYEGFQRSGNRAIKKCTRCGKSPIHGRKDCPAKEAECGKCFVKGHYAAMGRSKKTGRRGCEWTNFSQATLLEHNFIARLGNFKQYEFISVYFMLFPMNRLCLTRKMKLFYTHTHTRSRFKIYIYIDKNSVTFSHKTFNADHVRLTSSKDARSLASEGEFL